MRDSRASGRSRKAWFIPAIAIVFIGSFAGQAKSADRLRELMELTGLDKAFDEIGAGIKVGMKQALPNNPTMSAALQGKVIAAMEPAADAAFAPETLKREFRLGMTGKLAEADLDSIFAFYKSPLGARITALENAAQSADAQAQITKMAGGLLERLKNEPERAKVLTLMNSSLRLTENATDVAFNMGRAVAVGMAAADERTAALTDETIGAIDSEFEKMRPAMTAQIKKQVLLTQAYTYRDVSIPEVRQYLEFIQSPAGKRFYDAAMPAMSAVLVKAGGDFGHALMRELGKERT
jgi:hypothetical protein